MDTEKKKTNDSTKTRLVGAGLIIFAALLWSLDGIYLRPQLYSLDPLMVVTVEHFLGFVLLSPFIVAYWPKIKLLGAKDWLSVVLIAMLGGLLGTLAITKAFFAAFAGATTFASVVIIQKLQPVFALVLSRVLLKERLSIRFYPWAILAVVSSFFLVIDNNFSFSTISFEKLSNHAGILALLAAMSFGFSTVLGKNLVNHINHKASTALRFGLTLVISLVFLFVFDRYQNIFAINSGQWKIFIIIALTSGATAMFIYYQGLRKVPASLSSILELFWPFSAIILDYVINKNVLTSVQFIFAFILLLSIFKAIKSSKVKPYVFTSTVVSGDKRGEKLGFPTINLEDNGLAIPHGVYLVNVDVYDSSIKALMHFGARKTFGNRVSTEIFLERRVKNLPQKISVEVIKKIREIKKFKNEKELISQIEADVEKLKLAKQYD